MRKCKLEKNKNRLKSRRRAARRDMR